MVLSGILPKGYEARAMHLKVSRHYPSGFWDIRLSDGCYNIAALFDGREAGEELRKRAWRKGATRTGFRRKRDALAFLSSNGFALGDSVRAQPRA